MRRSSCVILNLKHSLIASCANSNYFLYNMCYLSTSMSITIIILIIFLLAHSIIFGANFNSNLNLNISVLKPHKYKQIFKGLIVDN